MFLKGIAMALPKGDEHWLLGELANAANVRIVTNGMLSNGMRMRLVWTDGVSRAIRANGWFEPETVAVVRSLLTPQTRFYDVGAQLGQYTLLAAGLSAAVHAFEPDPDTHSLLAQNVRMNDVTATLNRFALSDHCGTVAFYQATPENIGESSCLPLESARKLQVECHTLDCYAERHGLPDLIKLDVEGAETTVLRGAPSLLARKVPMIIEFAPRIHDCAPLADFLRSYGYYLQRITDCGLVPYVPQQGDYRVFNVLAA